MSDKCLTFHYRISHTLYRYTRAETHYKSHIWVNIYQCAANDKSSIFVYLWESAGPGDRCTYNVMFCSMASQAAAFWPFVRPAASPGLPNSLLSTSLCSSRSPTSLASISTVHFKAIWVDFGWGRPLPDVDNRLLSSIFSPPSQKSTGRNCGKMTFRTFASSSPELRQDGSFEADRKHFKLGACSELRSLFQQAHSLSSELART